MTTPDEVRRLAGTMRRDCVATRVRQLNRRVTRLYDAALRPHGITTAQLNVLVALALLSEARAVDVAATLALEKSTLSRNLARMIERGWISAATDTRGSGQQLRLLAAGREIVERAMPAWQAAQRQVRKELEPALVDALSDAPSLRTTRDA